MGIAETAVAIGVDPTAHHDDADIRHGKGEHRPPPSRCDRVGQIAQMHRQFRGNLGIRELIEPLQEGAFLAAIEQHRALAAIARRPALSGVAAIVISGAAPDVFQPFLTRHRPHGAGFALDDGVAHALGRALVGQVAIAMEMADIPVDRQGEKDAGDRAGQEFAHCEHLSAHKQRWQDLEHMVVGCLANLEPFAAIESTVVTLPSVRALRMTVEHAEHLPTIGDALIDFTDRGEGHL
ncbi:conserved hypothetical protein [Agrobacterium fabrum str. J-07]|nr:conserved hypothetical protein [Agrobacterium fabrum str. J-07]